MSTSPNGVATQVRQQDTEWRDPFEPARVQNQDKVFQSSELIELRQQLKSELNDYNEPLIARSGIEWDSS